MERSGPGDAPDHGARGAPPSEQAASGPGAQQSQLRAVPCGLEAYPSLQAAFAAPQPSNTHGLQKHGSTVQARLQVKTPGSQKLSDTNLPLYQHLTDMALARDVAMLWRALDDSTPEHASFTPEKCKFNHDVEYMKDEALVAKLRSLPDFLELKAFLVEVLEPPPRPAKAQQVTPLKRKRTDWTEPKQKLHRVKNGTFEKLLSEDNMRRLSIPTAAMKAKPFEWEPEDPASKEPPTMLLSCEELGVENVNATLGKRTTDGYRMGVGTQGLMKKLKAQPEDILQLRVTKRERNTLWVDLRLNRLQAAASDGVEGSGAQTGGGAATEGGGGGGTSVPASGAAAGGEAVDSRAPAASGAAAGGGAAVSGAGLARGGSVGGALPTSSAAAADEVNPQPPEHSESEYIGSDDDDDDGDAASREKRMRTSQGEQQAPGLTPQQSVAAAQQPSGPPKPEDGLPHAGTAAATATAAAPPPPPQQQQQQQPKEPQQPPEQPAPQQAKQEEQPEQPQTQQPPEQPTPQQPKQEEQAQQQHTGDGRSGMTSSGGGAAGPGSHPQADWRELAEQVLKQRLDAAAAMGEAASSEDWLSLLQSLAEAGFGGVLLQRTVRRWASGQLLEDSRANIVVAMKLLVLYDNWHRQLEWQLGLALDDAGETWHHDIAEGSGGSDEGAKGPPAAAVALLQKPAVKACTDAAAALAKSSADVADKLLCLLGRLSMGYVHCQPLKEAVQRWASYNHTQQRALFESALVVVHQGAWQELEGRMQVALQRLPRLAEQA